MMKYLKYFESIDIDYYNGLTKEFIEDIFIDISDNGFNIMVYFDKRAVVKNPISKNRSGIKTEFGTIPYIWIKINQKYDPNIDRNKVLSNLIELKKSDELREIKEVCNDRLEEFGWFVSDDETLTDNPPSLRIFIHRKIDEKYVK